MTTDNRDKWLARQVQATQDKQRRLDNLGDRLSRARDAGERFVKVPIEELATAMIVIGLVTGVQR